MDGLYMFGLLNWSGQYARRITWDTLGQLSLRNIPLYRQMEMVSSPYT